ncbi:Cytochrome c oxidase subunit Vb [Zostera marina]|uniref:Cytochrome c oxidase subunit Vb n=1 Tax=Zostera marina TaxID=29655 RepID=A0A0K9P6W1_ZOSMR|nr:Cytochrome c oxidase subunit Vb [Zostera marina]
MMWRNLQIPNPLRSKTLRLLLLQSNGGITSDCAGRFLAGPSTITAPLPFHARFFSSESSTDGKSVKKKTVEDVMPNATGLEREEIEAELEGKKRFDMDAPCGPFGTKEAPAVIQSFYDKRIVGCPGGEGEDEHDVVWFWLEKGKAHECPVCSQYFMLEVVGAGGPPDGHGDDHDH